MRETPVFIRIGTTIINLDAIAYVGTSKDEQAAIVYLRSINKETDEAKPVRFQVPAPHGEMLIEFLQRYIALDLPAMDVSE
jgi:hypothetical protein